MTTLPHRNSTLHAPHNTKCNCILHSHILSYEVAATLRQNIESTCIKKIEFTNKLFILSSPVNPKF